MKILFTFFNPSGGMETLNRIRSNALKDHGIESHLLYNIDGEGRQNIKDIRTIVTSDSDTIRNLIEQEKYDAVIVCSDIHMLVQIRSFGYGGRLIFEFQGLGTPEEATQILQNFKDPINRHADALLYPRTAHLRRLMRSFFPDIQQYCFDDPLDCKNFGYTAYPQKAYPIIGWIGRIQANKNWREFLQMGQRLIRLHPGLSLWLFDDDTLSDSAELTGYHQILEADPLLSSRLFRYSNIPHELMADYLSIIGDSGGLLVSTSIREGFGYAVAEAMLCRCPVLSTDSGGVRRFIFHNRTGKFYTRGNLDEAVKEALSLMINIPLRNRLIQSAEMHIHKHFSADLYAEHFIAMLYRLDAVPSTFPAHKGKEQQRPNDDANENQS
ncbi:glycosyltransferase family 4 protein [Paenibacillus dokdonensis]|uniref:Glycosyltransferase family 4 protein n=1 Tax=Paenibacillus dokdonensis TaxID=2567944 RepID=A0ABU6GMC7_9BACL|nr:glycosyltransferase family 4 protein [Paenibacillus dokdonensis]MEC0240890.1 glycosyltransferase family 4 protein [Paenibacillus dokdonensis]